MKKEHVSTIKSTKLPNHKGLSDFSNAPAHSTIRSKKPSKKIVSKEVAVSVENRQRPVNVRAGNHESSKIKMKLKAITIPPKPEMATELPTSGNTESIDWLDTIVNNSTTDDSYQELDTLTILKASQEADENTPQDESNESNETSESSESSESIESNLSNESEDSPQSASDSETNPTGSPDVKEHVKKRLLHRYLPKDHSPSYQQKHRAIRYTKIQEPVSHEAVMKPKALRPVTLSDSQLVSPNPEDIANCLHCRLFVGSKEVPYTRHDPCLI